MLVTVTKFAGTSLAINGVKAAILNPGAMPSARPVFIEQSRADQTYSGTYSMELRNVALQLHISDHANRYDLMAQIKSIFKRGARGDLEATFSDDATDYRLDCVVVRPPIQDADYPWYFTVILQTGDSDWRAVAEDVLNWTPSGAGGTQDLTVEGNDETRLSLDVTPTTGPSAGFLYKKLYRLVNVPGIDFGTRAWCLTIDHAALVTAGKSQSDGDDLRIWLGEVETRRWISGPNTTTTKIWFNVPIPKGYSLDLLTAIAGSGDIAEIQFEKTPNAKKALNSMPASGIVYHGTEWFYYSGKEPTNYKLTGITRTLYGTTIQAHSADDTFSFIAQPIWLLYGNSTVTAPATDDANYDDDKPLFNLADSDNTKWVYDATTKFYDPDHPTRPGTWKQAAKRAALNLDTYLYNIKGDAASGDPALGARAANYKSGSTWKADTIGLAWSLYCAAGFYRVSATGRKYRSSSIWPSTAAFQYSANGSKFTNLWNEASPSAEDTFENWATHTNVSVPSGSYYLRQYFFGAFAASPNDSYALCEGLTVTAEFISANLPAESLLSEQSNAQLAAVIENTANGDKLSFEIPLKVNELLELNGEDNTVLLGGANAYRALALDDESRSIWIRLQPGLNTISISGVDLGTLDIDLKYFRRRLH